MKWYAAMMELNALFVVTSIGCGGLLSSPTRLQGDLSPYDPRHADGVQGAAANGGKKVIDESKLGILQKRLTFLQNQSIM